MIDSLPPPNAPIWRFVEKAQRKGIIPVAVVMQDKRFFSIDDPSKDVNARIIDILNDYGPLNEGESLDVSLVQNNNTGAHMYILSIAQRAVQLPYGYEVVDAHIPQPEMEVLDGESK